MSAPGTPNPLTPLLTKLMERIRQEMPAPNIRDGVVESVVAPAEGQLGRVVVVIDGADTGIPCSWSAGFDLEISALGQDLVGRSVEVHFIDNRPRIAYSHVRGDLTR